MSHKPLAIRTASLKRAVFAIPVVSSLLISAPSTYAQIPCAYEVTAIIQALECPPFGFPPTIGTAISEPIDGGLPNAVGYYQSCTVGPDTAFLWIGNEDRFITLDMPPGTQRSWAYGMSADATQIVGTAEIGGVGSRAFLIDGDDLIVIPPANGGTFSNAQAVSLGRVAGTTSVTDRPPFYSKAYIWQDGVMTIIEPTFGPRSAGHDINEAGAVVGWMGNGIASDSHPFIWDGRTVIDIGLAPNTFASWAKAVNDVGVVLVRGEFDEGEPRDRIIGSFVFEDGTFTDLDTLPGYDVIAGFDLNNDSIVVGIARAVESSDEPDVGFIWHNRVMRNLNDFLPMGSQLHIQRAEGINQAGEVTGRALDRNNDVVGFILTPIEGPIGDLDGDCAVGVSDLLLLLNSWGPCNDCAECPADFNDDCAVGVFDLLVLLSNWG